MNWSASVPPPDAFQFTGFESLVPSMMITSTTAFAPAPDTKLVALVYSDCLTYGVLPVLSMVAPEWPKLLTFTDDPNRPCRSPG